MSKMGQTAHVYLANIMQFSFSSKWGEYIYFGCFVHIGRVREDREDRKRKGGEGERGERGEEGGEGKEVSD